MNPTPSLLLIWDYDTAIGQVNATFPYNFHEERLFEEIANVDRILELTSGRGVAMTFACVGFAAEAGQYPYHVPEQIRRLRAASHEIASHSWRHEWLPFLEREQVRRTLARSKKALEECIGEPGSVVGFVPPFSRPMTWFRKGAISLGDRSLNPFRRGGNIGSLCGALREGGYSWCRVSYRSMNQRLHVAKSQSLLGDRVERSRGVACIPHHYTGFDDRALQLVESAATSCRSVVIVGHPSGLSRSRSEGVQHLERFLDRIGQLQEAGSIRTRTVSEHLASRMPESSPRP